MEFSPVQSLRRKEARFHANGVWGSSGGRGGGGGEHAQGAVDEVGSGGGFGQSSQRNAQRFGLRAEATNPELAALVGHRRRRGLSGVTQRLRQQQPRDEKQRDH